MTLERYTECDRFLNDTLNILCEHESQNIHTIGTLIFNSTELSRNVAEKLVKSGVGERDELIAELDKMIWNNPDGLQATVKDSSGKVLLTAHCSFPYDKLTIFATQNKVDSSAVKCFTDELKAINYKPKTIRAERSLASEFIKAYGGEFTTITSLYAMQLEKIIAPPKVSGFCRPIEEKDLHFAPFWKAECLRECGDTPMSLSLLYRAYRSEINENKRFLWEDTIPVSQANLIDETENSRAISDVYTPPFYRKKGYATALVAELSRKILEQGKRFCVLFADSKNATSCEIYRKIGFYDLCIIDETRLTSIHDKTTSKGSE
jgi:predicted GNAT family acetyltransferase